MVHEKSAILHWNCHPKPLINAQNETFAHSFREDDHFLSEVFGIRPTPKFDKYADAIAMLEKGKIAVV